MQAHLLEGMLEEEEEEGKARWVAAVSLSMLVVQETEAEEIQEVKRWEAVMRARRLVPPGMEVMEVKWVLEGVGVPWEMGEEASLCLHTSTRCQVISELIWST